MKISRQYVLTCIVAMLLTIGMGCGKKLDDAKMSSEIQSKFNQDSGLASKQLTVQANNGVVTLSGSVENVAQRDAAGVQAASIPGVRTVINNLQVVSTAADFAPPSKPAAATEAASIPEEKVPAQKPSKATKTRTPRSRGVQTTRDTSNEQAMAANYPPPDNSAAAPAPNNVPAEASAPVPPPAPKRLIIDQGTQLTIRLIDPVDSEKNQTGDTFRGTLNAPLTSDGEVAVPAGVELTGHLVEVKSAGKFAGQSSVVMQLDSLKSGGKSYDLQTDQYKKTGSSRGKNTAEKVGGGAVLGGIIGAIAGGGKGAAIGAAAGAGVGGGVQAASKSQQIKLPSETVLNFTLQAPVTVVQATGDASRQKLSESQ